MNGVAVLAPEQATQPTQSQASNGGGSGLQEEKDKGLEEAKERAESTDTFWF